MARSIERKTGKPILNPYSIHDDSLLYADSEWRQSMALLDDWIQFVKDHPKGNQKLMGTTLDEQLDATRKMAEQP